MSSINYNTKSFQNSLLNVDDQPHVDDQGLEDHFFSISKKYTTKIKRLLEQERAMDMVYNFRIKTQTKTQKDVEAKEEKSRKSRNSKEGRIFKCGGCSSDYLSYPALYTHIKTKHGGVIPQGTMRGQNGKVKKRGRPKTRRNPQTLYERETFQSLFPKSLINLVQRDKLQVLEQYSCEKEQDQNVDISTKFFVSQLRQIKSRKEQKQSIKTMSINKIVTVFLYNVKQYFHSDLMLQFQSMFKNLIEFINLNYMKILRQFSIERGIYIPNDNYQIQKSKQIKNLQNTEEKVNNKYCDIQQPRFMPVLIQKYLQIHHMDEQDQIQKVFLLDFCKWLFDKKLTNLVLMKNQSRFILKKIQDEQ